MVFLCDLQYGDEFYWCGNFFSHHTVYEGDCPSIMTVVRLSDGQVIRLKAHTEVEYA